MSEIAERRNPGGVLKALFALGGTALLAAFVWVPDQLWETIGFVVQSLFEVAPIVIPGIVLASWVSASGAGDRLARVFGGRIFHTVVVASAIGAVTPVCGVTVLPLMAGLLAAGVPLAPVMAFWLSSPVTDPAMLATTAATLGFEFAIGKTAAAFGLGLLGGFVTATLARSSWTADPLRSNQIVGELGKRRDCNSSGFELAVWTSAERRSRFWREFVATTRLILICLIPAFAAEHVLNALLHPEALSAYVGSDAWWAVPLAVFVGAPAYLDGYAALPLTRALIGHGMSQGAAMAFLVSGGVVSIWGAMVIFPVLKLKPFMLFLGLAVAGSLMSGWIFDLLV